MHQRAIAAEGHKGDGAIRGERLAVNSGNSVGKKGGKGKQPAPSDGGACCK